MLSRRSFATGLFVVGGLLELACDSDDSPSHAVPARASESTGHLPERQHEPAQALVRLESAARARDGQQLCEQVYLFAGGPSRDCADSLREHFSTEDGFSVAIRTIRFTSRRKRGGDGRDRRSG